MKNILFICGRNRRRSPTAEQIFATHPGVETASAGIGEGADTPLEPELLEWDDLIVVMERAQRQKLTARYARQLKGKRIVCLDIPDKYDFMDSELVRLLKAKMAPLLK